MKPGVSAPDAAWSYIGEPVPGYLKEENYTSAMQACLRVKVNKADYERALSMTIGPLQKLGITPPDTLVFQAYKLGADDCMGFMISVAKVLEPRGLNVPTRGATELPVAYMKRLMEAN